MTQSEPAGGWRVRGHPTALAASRRMVSGSMPHALLLVGPAAIGKTTLAMDLAAALLCTAPDPGARPCRECRGCRLVDGGNHPDLHHVAPEGPGRQIIIASIRRLLSDLALLPAEGGARVAVVESAHRMTEDAQNAVLKTLEEPPAGVALVLCADDEERLLPTIRSRCARLRLGPVSVRDIEELLGERGLADAPAAARLARIAAGRPGLAIAYARAPDAVTIRSEIARTLLDLVAERPARRLAIVRDLASRAGSLAVAIEPPAAAGPTAPTRRGRRPSPAAIAGGNVSDAPMAGDGMGTVGDSARAGTGGANGTGRSVDVDAASAGRAATGGSERGGVETGGDLAESGVKAPPSERRRNALVLLDLWRDVARDLALVTVDNRVSVRDPGLLEELEHVAARIDPEQIGPFLVRLGRTALVVDGNANPELALDTLVLGWPHALAVA